MCAKATMEEFEALLNESFEIDTPDEGSVVKGKVIAIEAGQAIIDVGYKMEGRVDLKEFASPGEAPKIESATRSMSICAASRTRAARP
jgi:small subunit ribosomal protein S1